MALCVFDSHDCFCLNPALRPPRHYSHVAKAGWRCFFENGLSWQSCFPPLTNAKPGRNAAELAKRLGNLDLGCSLQVCHCVPFLLVSHYCHQRQSHDICFCSNIGRFACKGYELSFKSRSSFVVRSAKSSSKCPDLPLDESCVTPQS